MVGSINATRDRSRIWSKTRVAPRNDRPRRPARVDVPGASSVFQSATRRKRQRTTVRSSADGLNAVTLPAVRVRRSRGAAASVRSASTPSGMAMNGIARRAARKRQSVAARGAQWIIPARSDVPPAEPCAGSARENMRSKSTRWPPARPKLFVVPGGRSRAARNTAICRIFVGGPTRLADLASAGLGLGSGGVGGNRRQV